jgi:hypothetical protein
VRAVPQVVVLVCNNRPNRHEEFDDLRKRYDAGPYKSHFAFVQQSNPDPDPGSADGFKESPNKPGPKVQQQTRDVVGMLEQAKELAQYVLIMEDDFVLCDHGLRALHYLVDKAGRYTPNWSALRVSYGLTGFVFKSADIPVVTAYLLKHIARRPPDHLVPELIGKETDEARSFFAGRDNVAYKWNLLAHAGKFSTLRSAASQGYAHCGAPIVLPPAFSMGTRGPAPHHYQHQNCSRTLPCCTQVPRVLHAARIPRSVRSGRLPSEGMPQRRYFAVCDQAAQLSVVLGQLWRRGQESRSAIAAVLSSFLGRLCCAQIACTKPASSQVYKSGSDSKPRLPCPEPFKVPVGVGYTSSPGARVQVIRVRPLRILSQLELAAERSLLAAAPSSSAY